MDVPGIPSDKNIAIEIMKKFQELSKEKPTAGFYLDDHVTEYYGEIIITVDFDIQWARIHRRWDLIQGIDLGVIWGDVAACAGEIMSVWEKI